MENKMKEIAKALSKFHGLVPDIKKDSNNPFFKSKYAALDSILPAIKKPLADSGLAFVQVPIGICKLKTILIHIDSGETIEGEYEMTPAKNDPQGQGSAITYMRRYALVSMLGLNTNDDDDGNAASGQNKKSQSKNEVKLDSSVAKKMALKAIEESNEIDTLQTVNQQILKSKNLTNEDKDELIKNLTEKLQTFDPL